MMTLPCRPELYVNIDNRRELRESGWHKNDSQIELLDREMQEEAP